MYAKIAITTNNNDVYEIVCVDRYEEGWYIASDKNLCNFLNYIQKTQHLSDEDVLKVKKHIINATLKQLAVTPNIKFVKLKIGEERYEL